MLFIVGMPALKKVVIIPEFQTVHNRFDVQCRKHLTLVCFKTDVKETNIRY